MTKLPSTRILISIALVILFFAFLVAILFVTNLSFSVWEQLQQKPDWIIWLYAAIITLFSFVFGYIVWRLLVPSKKQKLPKKQALHTNNIEAVAQRLETISQKLSEQGDEISSDSKEHLVSQAVQSQPSETKSKSEGFLSYGSDKSENKLDEESEQKWANEFESSPNVAAIKKELQEYNRRKSQQTLYIALFGDISSGKSSVIKALMADDISSPEKNIENNAENNAENNSDQTSETDTIETSVIGGTTREICHYHWSFNQHDSEQSYILTDMPGLNEQFALLDLLATEEVQRAHIVIYLCDGDLTATQFTELQKIVNLRKPCIVAVNKSDRYSKEERELIVASIKERMNTLSVDTPVLSINAGGMREFIRQTPDGEEQRVQRPIEPDIKILRQQLHKMMQQYGVDQLELLREKSVASMVNNKLDDLDEHFRYTQSQQMVKSYTKKAVVASMATISPGTDLLVQGYLGIQMIKGLCKLYEVPATDIDANKLIELIQSRMKKTLPILLAIAGNGLKAFPGIGTVSGGLIHAVAYGMIFDTLGHSVARTLEITGELSPKLVSDLYKEQLGENIESRTKDFIKLVLKLRKSH